MSNECCYKWIAANAPGGWIDELRIQNKRLVEVGQQRDAALAVLKQIAGIGDTPLNVSNLDVWMSAANRMAELAADFLAQQEPQP